MPRVIHARVFRSIMATAVVMLGASACWSAPRVDPQPLVAPLIVRNSSQFDVNVYALPNADAKPVWLGTVPAAGSRTLAIQARSLQENSTLVVQTRAIGSSRSWTSSPVFVGAEIIAVLDVTVDGSGSCSASELRALSMTDVVATMRE